VLKLNKATITTCFSRIAMLSYLPKKYGIIGKRRKIKKTTI